MDSSLLTEDELEKTKKTTPGVRAEKLTMEYLIKATYRRVLLGDQPLLVGDGGQCKLAVVAPGGRSYHIIDASPAWQVSKLMKQIEKFDGTHVHEQRLFVDGRKLEVQKTLSDYVSADCEVTIHLFLQLQGGGACSIVMDSSLLDPRFDYDFTYLKSGKKVLYRGTPHTTGHMAKRCVTEEPLCINNGYSSMDVGWIYIGCCMCLQVQLACDHCLPGQLCGRRAAVHVSCLCVCTTRV